MTILVLMILDTAACMVIFWVCGSFLITRDKPENTMQGLAQLGLLLAMVGSFVTGVAPFVDVVQPGWWSVLLRLGIGLIAIQQYDRVFGIFRQWTNLHENIRSAPCQLATWWRKKLTTAHKAAGIHPPAKR